MGVSTAPSYRGYRLPAKIISHCVWLYSRFCLSLRDGREMMLERGIHVSHEAIRLRTLESGAEYARRLRLLRAAHETYRMQHLHEPSGSPEVWQFARRHAEV